MIPPRYDAPRTGIEIMPYHRRYRQDLRELLYRSYRSHVHLDWHDTDAWLDTGKSTVLLAWEGRRLVGAIAASEPVDGDCWIRIATIVDDAPPMPIMNALWSILKLDLRALQVERVAILMLREWLSEIFGALGFAEQEWIVTLRRESLESPSEPPPPNLTIRASESADIEAITAIDHQAFDALWRMTLTDIRQAMRGAASSTVALIQGVIVGYQISTVYFDGSHLARLAVNPNVQANGIGGALVGDVLRRFTRRGVPAMTVNTQLSNERSQRLYRRLGFQRTGYDLAVWSIRL